MKYRQENILAKQPSLYAETRKRVTKELQEAEYYSVTTDLWSSTGKLEPYLAVTVHYINKEWELKSYCLNIAIDTYSYPLSK